MIVFMWFKSYITSFISQTAAEPEDKTNIITKTQKQTEIVFDSDTVTKTALN